MMANTKKNETHQEKGDRLDFKGLEFEQVLADLLQIKPIENEDLKKDKPKKKKVKSAKEKRG